MVLVHCDFAVRGTRTLVHIRLSTKIGWSFRAHRKGSELLPYESYMIPSSYKPQLYD